MHHEGRSGLEVVRRLVFQCLQRVRGSIPTPGIYSAAIPLGKDLLYIT